MGPDRENDRNEQSFKLGDESEDHGNPDKGLSPAEAGEEN